MKKNKNETQPTLSLNKTGHVPRLTDPGLWSRIWDASPALLADEGYRARLRDEARIDPADHDDLVREYLRFTYLSWTSADGATPSKAVDEAWHTHILFTRSYIAFCEAAKGSYLHHQPGTGSTEDEARFRGLYHQTLDRYRAEFGAPPAKWWPDERPAKPEPAPAPSGTARKIAARFFNAALLFLLPVLILGGTGRFLAGTGGFLAACIGFGAVIGAVPAALALCGAFEGASATGRGGAGGPGGGVDGGSGGSCTSLITASTMSACSTSSCSSGCGGGGGGGGCC